MSRKTPLLIVLLIISLAFAGYIILNQINKSNIATPSKSGTKNECANFPEVKGEIFCRRAAGIALQKYPGEVTTVDKLDNFPTRFGSKNIWRIDIKLKNPISVGGGKEYLNHIDVGIDRVDGKILFFSKAN